MANTKKYGKKKTLRKKSVYRKRVVKKSGRPTPALRRMVQSIVSRNIENKSRQANLQMDCRYPQSGGVYKFNGLIPLTPYDPTGTPVDSTIHIAQGTGAASRVGNTIRTKRATLKGVLYPFPESEVYNPAPKVMEVCMWIFKVKVPITDNFLDVENIIDNSFFQSSNSTTGVTGDLINIVQAPNTDTIQLLHKRVFKLGHSGGTQSGNLSNNDFYFNRKFNINITKYLPKVVKFDDVDQAPTIKHTYALITPFCADGTVQSNQYYGCKCDYEINYVYEDA